MPLRITSNVTRAYIHEALRACNLAHREPSEDVPLGVFHEDEIGIKAAGLSGETFGNRLCFKYLWVSESLRRSARYAYPDTFSLQTPGFYKKHGYEEVFRLFDHPHTGALLLHQEADQ